jgi:hypothetical protein
MPHIGKTISKAFSTFLLQVFCAISVLMLLSFSAFAQSRNLEDSLSKVAKIKDTALKTDTSILAKGIDSNSQSGSLENRLGIKISEDALEEVVVATATDSL